MILTYNLLGIEEMEQQGQNPLSQENILPDEDGSAPLSDDNVYGD